MSHITLSNHEGTPFEKLLGHAPHILKQWDQLEHAFFKSTTFEPNAAKLSHLMRDFHGTNAGIFEGEGRLWRAA